MTGLHGEVDFVAVRSDVVAQARTTVPGLVDRITAHVQGSVRSYSGPETGRRHRLIEMATSAAIHHFLDRIEKPDAPSRSVDELFRRMGHGEATDGHDLDAMQAAFRIANHEAWEMIRGYATAQGWSADVLGWLGDALFAYIEHLSVQTQRGFEGATRALDQDPVLARTRLVDGLLSGAPLTEIRTQATKATWLAPTSFVVVAVEATGDVPVPELSDLDRQYLVRADAASGVILCGPAAVAPLLVALQPHVSSIRAAISWPVPREEVPDAWRWTTRALDLVRRGVIEPGPVVDCTLHHTQLWLHSESALRQRLCQDLLKPLLAESPNSREILSETLLAWLESRDSAPAIAATLGVHPQTVRYRWKRINELFGDLLREPEFIIQVTMLLKASVPLWKAGDQSDFERFRTQDAV